MFKDLRDLTLNQTTKNNKIKIWRVKKMPMVYQTLHNISKIELGEIEQLRESGSYTRKLKFSGFKGSMSKIEEIFDFLELTLFADNVEELEIIIK